MIIKPMGTKVIAADINKKSKKMSHISSPNANAAANIRTIATAAIPAAMLAIPPIAAAFVVIRLYRLASQTKNAKFEVL
jgi:hypothetical protein